MTIATQHLGESHQMLTTLFGIVYVFGDLLNRIQIRIVKALLHRQSIHFQQAFTRSFCICTVDMGRNSNAPRLVDGLQNLLNTLLCNSRSFTYLANRKFRFSQYIADSVTVHLRIKNRQNMHTTVRRNFNPGKKSQWAKSLRRSTCIG